MTIYSLGVLLFGIRELTAGLRMLEQSKSTFRGSPRNPALGPDSEAPAARNAIFDGEGVRAASGEAEVTTGGWAAQALLKMLGLDISRGFQKLDVAIVPDGDGELWRRDFASGAFTSRMIVSTEEKAPRLVEKYGPVSLVFALRGSKEGVDWQLEKGFVFGLALPHRLLPIVDARERLTEDGAYAFSIDIAAPVIGHLLGYSGRLRAVRNAV
jgi:hypothetical protein